MFFRGHIHELIVPHRRASGHPPDKNRIFNSASLLPHQIKCMSEITEHTEQRKDVMCCGGTVVVHII